MTLQHDDIRHWNRKLVNMMWVILCVAIAAQIIGLVFDSIHGATFSDIYEDIVPFFVEPSLWLLAVTLIGESVVWLKVKYAEYAILLVCSLFPSVITLFFSFIPGIQFTLLCAIIVSALYYQRSKIVFSSIVTIIAYTALLVFCEPLRSVTETNTIIFTLSLFIAFAFLIGVIMNRGLSLLKNLEQSVADHQLLFIENITKDRMTKIDGLTQIYNRKAFDELAGELAERDFTFSLAILDIDNFKSINDTFGHSVGDKVLQEIANCATGSMPSDDFVCRYGGEEFAIVFFESEFAQVKELAETLRRGIEAIHIPELGDRRITASIGLSERQAGQSVEDLVKVADALLYRAKRTGKNRVTVNFTEEEAV